jgi:alkanesulfonate monooxygenase SsuD/methylene tetrahydromethanopterin reductase-like flavin-dependent oxidoreductase (luciferase family)
MSSLELGLGLWTTGREEGLEPETGFLRLAELAERLGYHSIWLPESHFDPSGACPSPLLLLAAAGARTSRIRLGTTSYLLTVRHPLQVAEDVAVLDRLSGGRVLLGIGRGFRPALFSAFGVPAEEKRDRFEAVLREVLGAWRGEPLDGTSQTGGSGPVRIDPLPLQKPHPPLWVAAFGPMALSQAGRLGLPYLASPVEPIDQLEENYARHRAALPRDRAPGTLAVPVIRTVFVSESAERVREVREALGQFAGEVARRLGRRFARIARRPVEDWALVGEPAEVAEGIVRYRERIGLTHLIARSHAPGASREEVERSATLLAQRVLPSLR